MTRPKRVTERRREAGAGAARGRIKAKTKASGKGRGSLSLMASAEEPKSRYASMEKVLEQYRPLKKPVTMRLDADVLAWFKKGGRRYQTRINRALRKVMTQEMKQRDKK